MATHNTAVIMSDETQEVEFLRDPKTTPTRVQYVCAVMEVVNESGLKVLIDMNAKTDEDIIAGLEIDGIVLDDIKRLKTSKQPWLVEIFTHALVTDLLASAVWEFHNRLKDGQWTHYPTTQGPTEWNWKSLLFGKRTREYQEPYNLALLF